MKIKKAIILGAGFGKRMHPITKKIPKPLVKINGVTLLENSIKFLSSIGVEHIVVNTHHLHKKMINYVNTNKFPSKVNIIVEKGKILDTGGGILNASKKFKNQIFYVLNPDTIWTKVYKKEFRKLEKAYSKHKKPTMLLVSRNKSYDKSFKGDFNLNNGLISRDNSNEFIFTGLQILDQSVFSSIKDKKFSMNKIWDFLIKENSLIGNTSKQKFYHLNTKEMYDKLSNLNITD